MKKQIQFNDDIIEVEILDQNPRFVLFNVDGKEYSVNLNNTEDYRYHLNFNGQNRQTIAFDTHVVVDGVEFSIDAPKRSRSKSKTGATHQMISPMPGKILKVLVKDGEEVKAGSPILVMEAMKMEHTIKASKDGVIEKVLYKEGDQVQGGVELVKLC